MAMSPSCSARRGALVAPVLLLLCGTVSANASANTTTSATSGVAPRAAASTSTTGSISVVPVASRTDCGAPGERCCGAGDKQQHPCIREWQTFCLSGICVFCGGSGEPCCPGSTCDFTNSCNANNMCAITCGLPDLPCCPEEQDHSSATEGCQDRYDSRCLSDVCTRCGGIGQPCCNDDKCERLGSECNVGSGVCGEPTCGVPGLPCCDDADNPQGRCESAADCIGGSCVKCGVNGAACCNLHLDSPGICFGADGECTEEGICAGGRPDAPYEPVSILIGLDDTDCGLAGQRCCGADDDADSPCFHTKGSFCSSEICASCGSAGEACCTDSACIRSECNIDNICAKVCGINGFRCCTAYDLPYDYTYGYDLSPDAVEGPDGKKPFSILRMALMPLSQCGENAYEQYDSRSGSLCSAGGMCTPCGEEGEQCCKYRKCFADRVECDTATNICTPPTCGREGQPCCDPSQERGHVCDSRLNCVDGKCDPCGFEGQRCCGDTDCFGDIAECSAETTCVNALTPGGDCGFFDDPCCEGGNCSQGYVCVDETCRSCGREDRPCCRGDTCEYAADCTDNVCGPPVCGTTGLPCCAGDASSPPCKFAACVDGECVRCGSNGEPCCTDRNFKCRSGVECSDRNLCEGS